jgi:hypothetical protein
MSSESSSTISITGTCPYPDCGATVNLGKKFCKTCGRLIQGEGAGTPPPIIEAPTAAEPEASLTTGPPVQPGISHSEDVEPVAAAAEPPAVEPPPSPPRRESTPEISKPVARNRPTVAVAAGIFGLLILVAAGYSFLKPKSAQVVAVPAQAPITQATPTNPAQLPPVPPTVTPSNTIPPQGPASSVVNQPGSTIQRQQDDALRRERERLAAERARMEQIQQEAREQEQRRQQELAQRQQEAEAQQRSLAELKAKQEEQQRQIDEERRKLVEEQARRKREAEVVKSDPTPPPSSVIPLVPVYRGPRFGEIVWEGTIKGTDLITIENGQASSGTVIGNLPGVAVLIQPTDTKKVSIASSPGPRNQYRSVVFRVSGNGNMRVTLKWSLP